MTTKAPGTNSPPPPPAPADSAYFDAMLHSLPAAFAGAAAAPLRDRPGPQRCIFTLRQVTLYTWCAVEWRILTDTRKAKAPIMAYRVQLDEGATRERFRAAFEADPRSAALEPILHRWECRVPEGTLTWAMRKMRTIRVPLAPGVSGAAPATFPICTLEAGAVMSALQAEIALGWQNPRRGAWDEMIEFFHTFWHRLECHLDGRRPPAKAPIPPRGGLDGHLAYLDYLERHPLVREPAARPRSPARRRCGR